MTTTKCPAFAQVSVGFFPHCGKPGENKSLPEILEGIQTGKWASAISHLRSLRDDKVKYDKAKTSLPSFPGIGRTLPISGCWHVAVLAEVLAGGEVVDLAAGKAVLEAEVAGMGAGVDAGSFDALQTVGAFFNDPTHADGDIRVLLEFAEFGIPTVAERTGVEIVELQAADGFLGERIALVVVEEVEAAGFEGTVVRAIAGADAAVIHHHIQTIRAVNGPDVELVIDHIDPVAKGGKTSLLNLVTSCQPCNAGKSARILSDQTIVVASRKQAAEIQKKREEVELMLQWRAGLESVEKELLSGFESLLEKAAGRLLSEYGRKLVAKTIKKSGFEETMASLAVSIEQYEGAAIIDNLPGIIAGRKMERENPGLARMRHAANIMRKRWDVWHSAYYPEVMGEFESLLKEGYNSEQMFDLFRVTRSMREFRRLIREIPNRNGGDE